MPAKSDFERITTGIPGLDKLIEGGFVKGSTVLISGGTGTGKTIFSLQFLLEGLKNGENCMFISLEQKPREVVDDVMRFGWALDEYVRKKKLFIEAYDPFQITDITSPLLDKIKERNITRIAIDSTSVFGLYFKDPFEVRKQLFKLVTGLKDSGVTSLLTAELPEEEKQLSRFGVEEFIVDGVIILYYTGIGGEESNSLEVRKMRRTKHNKGFFPLEFTDVGLVVKKEAISVLMK